MNQSRLLLSLLSLLTRSIIDGCVPELGELRRFYAFLESSHSARGNVSMSAHRLADWVANLCDSTKGKLKPVPSHLACKRKRAASTILPVDQSSIRYVVLRVNYHFHGPNNVLSYGVTWCEPGSVDTLEPYSSLHHLGVLTAYEQQYEACPKYADFHKALYLCQRNKERDAMLFKNDTDSKMTKAEPASEQSNASTSESLFVPTLSPSSLEQSDSEGCLASRTWTLDRLHNVREEDRIPMPPAPVPTPVLAPAVPLTPFIGPALDLRTL
jgi:hypothetical protein